MRASGKLSVDYLGIVLTAVGFGCLEVMLDKGQREDWFESPIHHRLLVSVGCRRAGGAGRGGN